MSSRAFRTPLRVLQRSTSFRPQKAFHSSQSKLKAALPTRMTHETAYQRSRWPKLGVAVDIWCGASYLIGGAFCYALADDIGLAPMFYTAGLIPAGIFAVWVASPAWAIPLGVFMVPHALKDGKIWERQRNR